MLVQEHTIYPLAVRWFAEGKLTLEAAGQRCPQFADMVGGLAIGFLRLSPGRVAQHIDAETAPVRLAPAARNSAPTASPTRSSS